MGAFTPARTIGLLVGLALGFHLLLFLTHAWVTLTYPFQLDYGEGCVLYLTEVLQRHEPLYRPYNQPPFLAAPYAPLFPWLALLGRGAGPGFFGGRLVSVLSTLTSITLLGLCLGARRGRKAGLAGAVFFVANPVVLGWSCLNRIDCLGIMLTLGGLLAATRIQSKMTRWHFLAALCFTLAFLDKQTFVAGPVSVALAYLIRNRRVAVQFIALQGFLVACSLAAMYWVSDGLFFELMFRNNAVAFFPAKLQENLLTYVWVTLPLAVLACRGREAPEPSRSTLSFHSGL